MRLFYATLLWLTRFELAIAKKAPVRNPANIAALKVDEMKWERELRLYEVNHA
jgi:hypothetical protein